MSDNPKKAAAGWTDQSKLVFLLDLFDSGAATIDWNLVTLPPGKTKPATRMMLKRLVDQHRPQLDEMKAIREGKEGDAGENADGTERTKKLPKKTTKGKPVAKSIKTEVNDDIEEDNANADTAQGDDSGAANKVKTKSRAPRTKAVITKDDGNQSPPKRGAKKA